MNIVVLMAGPQRSTVAEGPSSILPIDGSIVIEKILQKARSISGDLNVVLVMLEKDRALFHLDKIVRLSAPGSKTLVLPAGTKGAACSALSAISFVNTKDETLVLNGDEFLDIDFGNVIEKFRTEKADGGIVVFDSVHPSFSFAVIDDDMNVEQIAEKDPISKTATVGFYYFRSFELMAEGIKSMIKKDAHVNGNFYLSPAYNELILSGLKVKAFAIESYRYHPLKSDLQINSFIRWQNENR